MSHSASLCVQQDSPGILSLPTAPLRSHTAELFMVSALEEQSGEERDLGARLLGFKSQLYQLLSVGPSSNSLNYLILKILLTD